MTVDEITPARFRELAEEIDAFLNAALQAGPGTEFRSYVAAALRAAAAVIESYQQSQEARIAYGYELTQLRATLAAREALLKRVLEHVRADGWLGPEDQLFAEIAAALTQENTNA